jgi:transcriptional regulator GlxA family with amidase domain
MRPSTSLRIVFAVYDGVSLLDLSGPLEAFRIADDFTLKEKGVTYKCVIVSTRGGPVRTADGVELNTQSVRIFAKKQIDTLVVPGAFDVENVTRDLALVQWLRKTAPACRRVCAISTGGFLLAASGILDGHRAAIHWMHAPPLHTLYPNVTIDPDATCVDDHGVWTSAGVGSGIDLALALIEQDAGREVAIKVARILDLKLASGAGKRIDF